MESVLYSIGAAVIGLGLLIVFHEFGHFLLAKLSAESNPYMRAIASLHSASTAV